MPEPTTEEAHLFDAFMLGWSIALALHTLKAPSEKAMDLPSAIRDVAEGRTTYVDSPADHARTFREYPEIIEQMSAGTPRRIMHERDIAQSLARVLAANGV
jgi:hypothetical protein